ERPRGVDAGAEPAARDPAAVAAAADALLVLSVDRADDPGLVPHVRELTALSLLRARPAPVGSDDRRRPAAGRADHEEQLLRRTVVDRRDDLLPVGGRGGPAHRSTPTVAGSGPLALPDGILHLMSDDVQTEQHEQTDEAGETAHPAADEAG